MSNKKYLFYDNIVRGAGIGHTLACYAYGLHQAEQKGMIFLADKMNLGHGVKNVEKFLGLKDFTQERQELLKRNKDLISFQHYKKAEHPTILILNWPQEIKDYLCHRYHNHRKVTASHIKKNHTKCSNIVRRVQKNSLFCS